MSRGYFLIAFGKNYIDEAVNFVKTLRKVGDKYPVSILCSESDIEYINQYQVFDKKIIFDFNNEFSDQNKTSFEKFGGTPKILMMEYIPYEETIYLDTDMIVQYDTSKVWDYFSEMDQCFVTTGFEPDENDEMIKVIRKKVNFNSETIYFIHSGIIYMNKTHLDYKSFYETLKFYWHNYYEFGLGIRLFRNGKADEHAIFVAYNKMNYKPINPYITPIITHNYHHDIELPSNIVTGGGRYNISAVLDTPPPFIHMFKDNRDNHYDVLLYRLLNM